MYLDRVLTRTENSILENFVIFITFIGFVIYWILGYSLSWFFRKTFRKISLWYFDVIIFLDRAITYISNWWHLRIN